MYPCETTARSRRWTQCCVSGFLLSVRGLPASPPIPAATAPPPSLWMSLRSQELPVNATLLCAFLSTLRVSAVTLCFVHGADVPGPFTPVLVGGRSLWWPPFLAAANSWCEHPGRVTVRLCFRFLGRCLAWAPRWGVDFLRNSQCFLAPPPHRLRGGRCWAWPSSHCARVGVRWVPVASVCVVLGTCAVTIFHVAVCVPALTTGPSNLLLTFKN